MRKINLENSLMAKCPEIAEEWDYDKNGNLTPQNVVCFSSQYVWWICPIGHSYQGVGVLDGFLSS